MQEFIDKTFLGVLVMMLLGVLARFLVSDEPFDPKRLIGEMIFASIGAVILYASGLLQGLTPVQLILLGGLSSLGGVRIIEHLVRFVNDLKKGG